MSHRNAAMERIRAFAVIAVVLYHFFLGSFPAGTSEWTSFLYSPGF